MIEWTVALILVGVFIVPIRVFRLDKKAREVLQLSNHAMGVIRHPDLDDEGKEKLLQHDSLALLRIFFLSLSAICIALLVPLLTLWILQCSHVTTIHSVLAVAASPRFILISILPATVVWVLVPLRNAEIHSNCPKSEPFCPAKAQIC